jgi:putative nucleotidyltransferase with HDIG domain
MLKSDFPSKALVNPEGQLKNRALSFFRTYTLSDDKVGHSLAVGSCAERVARRMKKARIDVDPEAAYAGGLLHDIGITKSAARTDRDEEENPQPEHALYGARDALDAGFPLLVVESIQHHENLGHTAKEIRELSLPPAVVGKTWASKRLEAEVVMLADQLVYITRSMRLNPWKDRNAIVEANFGYLSAVYRVRAGKRITKELPALERLRSVQKRLIVYATPRDVPEAWEGLEVLEPHK